MKNYQRLSQCALIWVILINSILITALKAQPIIPPGIPEPGLIIWGSVVNTNNTAELVRIHSAVWSVTDGTETFLYTGSTKPPTQIVRVDGQSYYILEIPFDSRSFGAITLSDPETDGIQSFELQPSLPPAYTLTPTINGVLATVREVNGATKFPLDSLDHSIDGFSAASRGQIVRVDLAINPPPDSYDTWAPEFFNDLADPLADRLTDADLDGFTNEQEYLAGTSPIDAASRLQVLTITPSASPNRVTLSWLSASNKSYQIAVATTMKGPWVELSTIVQSEGDTTQATLNRNSLESKHFYRISVLP